MEAGGKMLSDNERGLDKRINYIIHINCVLFKLK